MIKSFKKRNYKNFKGIILLNKARSIENVVNFKAYYIKKLGIKKFTEDNLKVVKGLRNKVGHLCEIIHFIDKDNKI